MECFRQEYWSGLPFLPPGDLSNPGTEPEFPALKADSLPSEPNESEEMGKKNLVKVAVWKEGKQYFGQ